MPAITIDQHYVEQFSANVRMLAEQQRSRLLPYMDSESVEGEAAAIDRMGTIADPEQVTSLYQDTNLSEAEYDRRWLFPRDYNLGSLIDKVSTVRMLHDPGSKIVMRHASSFGRFLDQTIINALIGNAYEGKRNGALTPVALPATQQLDAATIDPTGGGAMTVTVLRRVMELFQINEHMDQGVGGAAPNIVAVLTPRALTGQLLSQTETTSSDYNTVKALVNGEINSFMGMSFQYHNQLPKVGAVATCLFFVRRQAGTIGWTSRIGTTQSPRPDKRNIPQLLTEGGWGATRVEDTMVVTVTIDESV